MEIFSFAMLVAINAAALLWLIERHAPRVKRLHGDYEGRLPLKLIVAPVVLLGVIAAMVMSAISYVSTSDTEYLHGVITDRQRVHDSYVRSYECNCVCAATNSSGTCTSRVCQTCYEDHYTVSWNLNTTVGSYCIDSLDETTKSVYDEPDPSRYTTALVGIPFTKAHTYKNYFLLSPKSALTASPMEREVYAKQLTQYSYPTLYNAFDINLVVTPLTTIPKAEYNAALRKYLIHAGSSKQVNIVLVFTPELSESFRYALERHWRGGRKNDVIIIMGVDGKLNVQWSDVITLGSNAGNEFLASSLRAELLYKSALDVNTIMSKLTQQIDANYTRRPMSNYEYIEKAQKVPLKAYVVTVLVSIGYLIIYLWWLLALPNPFNYITKRIQSCLQKLRKH